MNQTDSAVVLQHFILTRFNLLLWNKDKAGVKVRSIKWLEHRFNLFEKYCLPSVKNQTCQDFEWIVLFDSKTPERFRERIAEYQHRCRQLIPVFVEPQRGRYFAAIFRNEIVKRMNGERVLSTYLDNDDALNVRFVEDILQRAEPLADGTFIRYSDGYQYYTEEKFMTRIHYPRNHFVSVIEDGAAGTVKGIFGYGGHFHIDEDKSAKIVNIDNLPMWCEVVHERNMINDANFLIGTRIIQNAGLLKRDFAINENVKTGGSIYILSFLPQYMKTFIMRAKNRIFGRKW